MRVYISGPMTSMPDHNIPAFRVVAEQLRAEGHFVINPAELSAIFGSAEEIAESFEALYRIGSGRSTPDNIAGEEWEEQFKLIDEHLAKLARAVLSADFAAVCSCDAIYMLKGWKSSRGARREIEVALRHNLKIFEEGEIAE